MFEGEQFVADCRAAFAEDPTHKTVREVLARAISNPTAVLKGLGEPQRMALAWILFAKGDRHVTAEMLYDEATRAQIPVSLATVYNTLHQFTDAGLLRQVAVDASKTYFDTNIPLTITFSSRTRTSSWTCHRPMCSSAPYRPHRKAMRLSVSMLSCDFEESRNEKM